MCRLYQSPDKIADLAQRCYAVVAWAHERRAKSPRGHWRALEVRVWARVWWVVVDEVPSFPKPPATWKRVESAHVPQAALLRAYRAIGCTEREAVFMAREPRTYTSDRMHKLDPAKRARASELARAPHRIAARGEYYERRKRRRASVYAQRVYQAGKL